MKQPGYHPPPQTHILKVVGLVELSSFNFPSWIEVWHFLDYNLHFCLGLFGILEVETMIFRWMLCMHFGCLPVWPAFFNTNFTNHQLQLHRTRDSIEKNQVQIMSLLTEWLLWTEMFHNEWFSLDFPCEWSSGFKQTQYLPFLQDAWVKNHCPKTTVVYFHVCFEDGCKSWGLGKKSLWMESMDGKKYHRW